MYSFEQEGFGGVTVSMVAFQAIDPGSTPGRRTGTFCRFLVKLFELYQLCSCNGNGLLSLISVTMLFIM